MTRLRMGAAITLLSLALPVAALAASPKKSDDGGLTNKSVSGTYSFRLVPATGFAATAPLDPGGVAGAPRQDILRVGVFTADGAGNLTGHTLATTDTNAGATMLIDFTWTGTYSVNPDGTGTLRINDPPLLGQICTDTTAAIPSPGACATDEEGAETYSIVVNNHASDKTIDLAQIDNVGRGPEDLHDRSGTAAEGRKG